MKQNNYKPQLPDVMEAIFDAAYLIFDLVAAILFFIYSNGDMLFILYGILTLTLCGGDAFHLVPRIIRAVCGSSDKIKKQLGIVLQISSITMTAFYIILMYIWKFTFPGFTIPVTLFSKTKPKVGLLMIPKTCAYMWIIAMGLKLLF